MNLNVAIVEDDPGFRRSYTDTVRAAPDLRLLAAAASGREGLRLLQTFRPDVMLIDLSLPDVCGSEVIRQASQRHPGIGLLVMAHKGDDEERLARCIEAGADGLMLKTTAPHDLAQAIRAVENGDSPISPCIARRVLQHLRTQAARHPPPEPPTDFATTQPGDLTRDLSPREVETLRLLAKGLSYQEIGQVLGIATHTVTTHVKRLYKKMGVHSRGEAVYEAGRVQIS
jgi:DNA-binding NarL/FixJ family response regulator